jgi:hypothetical protein
MVHFYYIFCKHSIKAKQQCNKLPCRVIKKPDMTVNYFNTLGTVLILYFSVDSWNSRTRTAL